VAKDPVCRMTVDAKKAGREGVSIPGAKGAIGVVW
jgi:hypothetical protein